MFNCQISDRWETPRVTVRENSNKSLPVSAAERLHVDDLSQGLSFTKSELNQGDKNNQFFLQSGNV